MEPMPADTGPAPAPEATVNAGALDGLRAVPQLTRALVDAIAPFVRYEDGKIALSLSATGSHVVHAASAWPALLPGRLNADEGFVTLRARVRARDATTADAWGELLDGLLGHVARAREAPPPTRLEAGVLVWERPLHRCEVLVVLERCLGRPLRGEIPVRLQGERVVLNVDDQHDARWETTDGDGVFDPWPFAVWLARRHLRLHRPALRVAIEPEGAAPRRAAAKGTAKRRSPPAAAPRAGSKRRAR
jgi:hypothetical protein